MSNSYADSDGTTRDESQVQKKMKGVTYDSYGKESYGEVLGNNNKGSSYWVSPEGRRFTLTWSADEAGFQPNGDHLPVAPVHEYELPVAPYTFPSTARVSRSSKLLSCILLY